MTKNAYSLIHVELRKASYYNYSIWHESWYEKCVSADGINFSNNELWFHNFWWAVYKIKKSCHCDERVPLYTASYHKMSLTSIVFFSSGVTILCMFKDLRLHLEDMTQPMKYKLVLFILPYFCAHMYFLVYWYHYE